MCDSFFLEGEKSPFLRGKKTEFKFIQMNKTENFLGEFNWEGKSGSKLVEVSCVGNSRGANLDNNFFISDYIDKEGFKKPMTLSRNIYIDFARQEASFEKLKGAQMRFVRVGEPLKIVIDFDTYSGRFLWLSFALHPDISVDGEEDISAKNKSGTNFSLTIPDRIAHRENDTIREKLKILQTLWSYKYSDLTNLTFFLGKSSFLTPKNYMTDKQLMNKLIGVDLNGWAMQNIPKVKLYHQMSDNAERQATILFNKARSYELVIYRNGFFIFNDVETLGGNEENAIEYINKNKSVHEAMRVKVADYEDKNDFTLFNDFRGEANALEGAAPAEQIEDEYNFDLVTDERARVGVVEKLLNDNYTKNEISEKCGIHHLTAAKYIRMVQAKKESIVSE